MTNLVSKTGSRRKPENYRSENLTNVYVKISEKFVLKFFKYADEIRIVSEKQHGFRTGYSCLTSFFVAEKLWMNMHLSNLFLKLSTDG